MNGVSEEVLNMEKIIFGDEEEIAAALVQCLSAALQSEHNMDFIGGILAMSEDVQFVLKQALEPWVKHADAPAAELQEASGVFLATGGSPTKARDEAAAVGSPRSEKVRAGGGVLSASGSRTLIHPTRIIIQRAYEIAELRDRLSKANTDLDTAHSINSELQRELTSTSKVCLCLCAAEHHFLFGLRRSELA